MSSHDEPGADPRSRKTGDEFELEPVASESADHVLGQMEAAEHATPDDDQSCEPGSEYRFTLKQLLVLMLIVSALLAVLRLLPPPLAAGFVGLIVLVGMVFLSLQDSYPAIVQLLWWLLLLLYLAMSVMAVVMH